MATAAQWPTNRAFLSVSLLDVRTRQRVRTVSRRCLIRKRRSTYMYKFLYMPTDFDLKPTRFVT
jgi:hypothetical protein